MKNKQVKMKRLGLSQYITSATWQIFERALRIISSFIVGIWVIRYLGPEQFGIYSYALSFVGVFAILAKLGLNNLIVKELVNKGEKSDLLVNTAFFIKLAGSILVLFLLILIAYLTTKEFNIFIYITIIGIGIIFQSFDVIEFYFQAKVNSKSIAITRSVQLILSSCVKIFLILIKADLLDFVLITLVDAMFLSLAYIFSYRFVEKKQISFEFDMAIGINLLRFGWPIALSNMAMMAYTKMDQIMIYNLINSGAVGVYAAATRISEAWYFFPTIITTSFFPAILNARSIDRNLYNERLKNLFSLIILIAISVAIPVTLSSSLIIELLYGEAFKGSTKVLTIHIWVGIFISLGMAASRWFIAEELQRLFLVRTLTGLVLNFVLNLLWVPLYGITGAASATLVSVIFANILSYLFHKRLRVLFVLTIKSFNVFGLYTYLRSI